MSEETNPQVEQPSAENEIDYKAEYEKLVADYTNTAKSKDRLLEESKGYKSKYQEYKSRVEELEKERLEREGTLEEKLAHERKRMQELANNMNQLKEKTVMTNFRSTLQEVAKDARDLEDLINRPEIAEALEVDDETLSVAKEPLQNVINSLKEKKPYLFQSNNVAKEVKGTPKPMMDGTKNLPLAERLKLALQQSDTTRR